MTRASQQQEGGAGATNLQAGRDLVVHGLTAAEARELALDVFHSNAVELAGVAQALAVGRAEQLTSEFLAQLESRTPGRVGALSDPDVQNVLFEAQRGFARSGEEDLREALVDLLAARVREDDRNLRTLALNEAILSAPKLTEAQRRAIAWVFYLRYTRDAVSVTAGEYIEKLTKVVSALGVSIPQGIADYQHIEYVGAGSVSISSLKFGAALISGVEALFTSGFAEGDAEAGLLVRLRSANLVSPALRDPTKVQLNCRSIQDLDTTLEAAGMVDDRAGVEHLTTLGMMTDEAVSEEIEAAIPAISPLREVWDHPKGAISSLTLTSVGIALGHAYFNRLTNADVPLEIWLP